MNDRRRSRAELRKGAPAFVDDANTGRRTGKFIPTVQLDEDGFESIEGLFGSQAYAEEAATVVEYSYIEEEEEEGESMELTRIAENEDDMDDYDIPEVQRASCAHSVPLQHLCDDRSYTGPRLSWTITFPLLNDSPNLRNPHEQGLRLIPRRSHSLMRSSSPIAPDPEPEEEEEEEEPEPQPEPEKSRRRTISRRSTLGNGDHSVDMELDEPTLSVVQEQDEEIDVDVGSPPPPPPPLQSPTAASSVNKPASKTAQPPARTLTPTPPPPANDDMEEEIANGLAQLDAGGRRGRARTRASRQIRRKSQGQAKGQGQRQRKEAEMRKRTAKNHPRSLEQERARRMRMRGKPLLSLWVGGKSAISVIFSLEWWRGEKFVYGRSPDPEEGPLLVPLIRAIERPPKPRSRTIQKGTQERRKEDQGKKEEEDQELGEVGVFGAPRTQEDGLDEETEELGVVMDYATGREVERRIAFPVLDFQKIFGDSDYFAAGNVYTIANISQRDAYIFFAQSRKVLDDSEEPPPLPREKESLPTKAKAKVVAKK
ncbi:centromere protein Scm3 [Rhizoctonia solani]|uniref:Centromere protein Scm3 n=1 Tax=Rhizoctonia solani TaxID=456999 RepID=A0A8H8T3D3_9AGAM|nr:centromere protein Scm3 [Rhizoctonia solani]QRW27764.1 centromere protein Scm3 [Rhizoctonia solani]